jgi:HEAT repeat protein
LRMMQAHDTKLKLMLLALAQKQHLIKIKHTDAAILHFEAIQGFQALGPRAVGAVPKLIKIFDQAPEWETAEVFGMVGPEAKAAVPSLLQGLFDTNDQVRHMSLWSLGRIHASREQVVPALVKALDDPVLMNRITAVNALASYGPDAKAAVPQLMELLKNENVSIAAEAATSLKAIDPEAAVKAGVK